MPRGTYFGAFPNNEPGIKMVAKFGLLGMSPHLRALPIMKNICGSQGLELGVFSYLLLRVERDLMVIRMCVISFPLSRTGCKVLRFRCFLNIIKHVSYVFALNPKEEQR
jgi:hypothetical protein